MPPLELVTCPKEQDNRRLKEIQLKSHSPANCIIIEQLKTPDRSFFSFTLVEHLKFSHFRDFTISYQTGGGKSIIILSRVWVSSFWLTKKTHTLQEA